MTNFGAHSGPKINPKMDLKFVEQLIIRGSIFGSLVFKVLELLGASWEPSWASRASLGRPMDPKNTEKLNVLLRLLKLLVAL